MKITYIEPLHTNFNCLCKWTIKYPWSTHWISV